MVETRDLDVFYRKNRKDMQNLIQRYFKNLVKGYDYEDVESSLMLHFASRKILERYDETKSKYSTYLMCCIRNFLIGEVDNFKNKTFKSARSLTNFDELDESSSTLDYLFGGEECYLSERLDIESMLKLLNPQQQTVLKYLLMGYRDTDIARLKVTNSVTSAGVGVLKRQLRNKLKKHLTKQMIAL